MAVEPFELIYGPKETDIPDLKVVSEPMAGAVQSEIENRELMRVEMARRAAKEEEDQFYNRGVSDWVHGHRDTEAAQFYFNYWASQLPSQP